MRCAFKMTLRERCEVIALYVLAMTCLVLMIRGCQHVASKINNFGHTLSNEIKP